MSLQSHLRLTKDKDQQVTVFDPIRRKNIIATPEEMVRQLWIVYLTSILQINPKLIAVERAFQLHGMKKRFDLIIFSNTAMPVLLAEFKSPGIPVTQAVFDQIAQYNMKWEVPFALVSNGQEHYCFRMDPERKGFVWEERLPF